MRRPAAPASANTLQSIDVQTLSGNQLQLTLHLAGPAPEPLAFTIDKPARISLDLPNTALALPSRRIDVGSAGVDTVLAAEANGRTRIVLNLDQQLPYQTRVSGNDIIVLVGAARRHAAASSAHAAPRRRPRRRATPRDQEHRFPSQRDRRRPAGRAPVRSAHADRPEAAGLADPGGLRRHRPAEEPDAPLRHDGFRHTGHRLRRRESQRRYPHRDQCHRQFRAAGLPVGRPVRGRSVAGTQGRGGQSGRPEEGIQGRAPDAELPGHRDARGAAVAGRRQRPEHRGQRHRPRAA